MVKFVGLIRLKPGYDPDETWELWHTKYSVLAKRILLPELKQYSINRVIKTTGNSGIYGFAEQLFDDIESCKRAYRRLQDNTELRPPFEVESLIAEFKEVPLL